MPRKRHLTLQEAQQADVDEGVAPWAKPDALRPLSVQWFGHMKRWAKRATAVTAILTAVSGIGGWAVKIWRYFKAGGATAPAELPKGAGNPTVATDFVAEPPRAPDGSAPGKQR